MPRETGALERALGHRFEKPELLRRALSHTSYAHEAGARPGVHVNDGGSGIHNEQLEFLGDAVLGLVVSEELFRRFPDFQEGQLSKMRAHLVSEVHLVRGAKRLKIGEHLLLGRGEEKSGGREKPALLVDAFEAIIAAMYLDGGVEPVKKLLLKKILALDLAKLAENVDELPITDPKSALQEAVHAMGGEQPDYVVIGEEGPEHQKTFTVEVRLAGENGRGKSGYVARAKGPTKKKAEQAAARLALRQLNSAKSTSSRPRIAAKSTRKGDARV
jgi:ribonuclease-3